MTEFPLACVTMQSEIATVSEKLTRRTALQRLLVAGTAGIAWPGCSQLRSGERARRPLRIGLVTDIHYADKASSKTRYYRNSLAKLTTAVAHFNELKVDFVVELGDFIDAADSVEQETQWLRRIESIYAQVRCPRYHVLGNHCVQTLTKPQFMAECGMSRSYSSFDVGGYHFVLLDACFRKDGQAYDNNNFEWTDANIPPAELDWLSADLRATHLPTIVFVHQRLDVNNSHGIRNQAEVRRRLEASGKVLAVFQGHNHINDRKEINGINYCSLAAMVDGDSNAYCVVTLSETGAVRVDGFGRHPEIILEQDAQRSASTSIVSPPARGRSGSPTHL